MVEHAADRMRATALIAVMLCLGILVPLVEHSLLGSIALGIIVLAVLMAALADE